MRVFKKYSFILFFFHWVAKGEPGDLIDYNFQENISLDVIQAGLIIAGGGLGFSPPEFTISTYDIRYESQKPDGNLDTLSGLVAIPNSTTQAFPTTMGLISKYFSHKFIKLNDVSGTTLAIIIPSISFITKPLRARSSVSQTAYSSAVRLMFVEVLQLPTQFVFLYTAKPVFVFPQSITRSIGFP